jgi:hypothetical protein
MFLAHAAETISALAEHFRTFRRWSEQGKFEQMHDRLRGLWRVCEGRAEAPSLWIRAMLASASRRSLQLHAIQVQVVRHPANKNVGRWAHPDQPNLFTVQADASGFVALAKRWVVERTHAWNARAAPRDAS